MVNRGFWYSVGNFINLLISTGTLICLLWILRGVWSHLTEEYSMNRAVLLFSILALLLVLGSYL